MYQFEVQEDGIIISASDGVGDLRGKISYEKLPSVAAMGEEERKHLGVLIEVCLSRLIVELKQQAHQLSFGKLKALQPVVIAPDKKLIVPGG